MSKRRRVNISVDPDTYDKLQKLKKDYGFSNVCELVVAFVNILLDRLEGPGTRKYDIPKDDGQYIDSMFSDLAGAEAESDNSAVVNGRRIHNHNR